jgi:formate hydrogenlyase subunit 4
MSQRDLIAGGVQVGGIILLAPLLPGLAQWAKARLEGRRGASALQPYRELARLWGKSVVDPAGTGPVYRFAPSLVAASVALAGLLVPIAGHAPDWPVGHDALALIGLVALARFAPALVAASVALAGLLVPIAGHAPDWPVGHDALALIGLVALARFALAAAAWDTGNGFALQGASRDLAISVAVEAALVLAVGSAALAASTTDLRSMAAAGAGVHVWSAPAQALALIAFLLVAIAETGRQPVDNPDTHLELTMIHEGPLLEYAGRDLALLQWATSARHWLVLALAAAVFLPHPSGFAAGLATLPLALAGLALALGLLETLVAKMRILLVPRVLGAGAGLALLALVARLVEAAG